MNEYTLLPGRLEGVMRNAHSRVPARQCLQEEAIEEGCIKCIPTILLTSFRLCSLKTATRNNGTKSKQRRHVCPPEKHESLRTVRTLVDRTFLDSSNLRCSLTAQHYALVSRNGWLLHPTVAASLAGKDNVEIVDVATGNG